VHQDPHREHVVARARGGLAGPALGRQVVGRAQRRRGRPVAVARERRHQRAQNPRVGDQRLSVGEQHVLGLQIAVGEAVGMGVGQRREHIPENLHGTSQRQLSVARQPGP
jgi:hypothetical protein